MNRFSTGIRNEGRSQSRLSPWNRALLLFILFAGWFLSVPFEGRVIRLLLGDTVTVPSGLFLMALHITGLLCVVPFSINGRKARQITGAGVLVNLLAGLLIPFTRGIPLWVLLGLCSFSAGAFLSCWAYLLRALVPRGRGVSAVGLMLIGPALVSGMLSAAAVAGYPLAALVLGLTGLTGALWLFRGLPVSIWTVGQGSSLGGALKPLVSLGVLIGVFSVTAGLMYEMVLPAFGGIWPWVLVFWSLPYLLVVAWVRTLKTDTHWHSHILIVGLTTLVAALVLFLVLPRTLGSFVLVDLMMMGTFGLFDLFWWSILGAAAAAASRPDRIFGPGLAINAAGVLLGNYLVGYSLDQGMAFHQVSVPGIFVVLGSIVVIPIIFNRLQTAMEENPMVMGFFSTPETQPQEEIYPDSGLTGKEKEVLSLLLAGYTYRAISEELIISENTVKFHVRNLYQKHQVGNRMELIRLYAEKDSGQ